MREDKSQEEFERSLRARFLVWYGIVISVAIVIVALIRLQLGTLVSIYQPVAFLISAGLVIGLAKRRTDLASHIAVASGFVLATVNQYLTNSSHPIPLLTSFLTCVAAFLLIGKNWGIGWTVAIAVRATILQYLAATNQLPTIAPETQKIANEMVATIPLELALLAILMILYHNTKSRAVARLSSIIDQRTTFLTNISHEIRTPLNGIIGILDHFQLQDAPDAIRSEIRMMQQSADSLKRILNDFLDFSKLDADKIVLSLEPTELYRTLHSCVELFATMARDSGNSLVLDVTPTARQEFFCDPLRLKQVINNLLSNAIKFTKNGQIRITATVDDDKVSPQLNIEVSDTGIGINQDAAKRLFEPFYQGHLEKINLYGGTGLGLAISRQLMRLMGGDITVKSEPGHGASFRVALPFKRAEGKIPLAMTTNSTSDLGRVLVVDDNETNRYVVVKSLESIGIAADHARDGREAVDMFSQRTYRCIFMDLQMPVMGGIDATLEIRLKCQSDVPVIGMSADVTTETRAAGLRAGMNHFIEKPINKTALIEIIQKFTREGDQDTGSRTD